MDSNRKAGMWKRALSSLLLALSVVGVMAQNKTITGNVTDETGEGVISATVMVKGTTVGTVTDFDGNYSLSVPADAKTLVISYVGYKSQELPITGNVVSTQLVPENQQLQEVVVTGYGSTKKRDLVTAVASVSSDQLKDVPVSTAAEALQGKLAGVNVTTTEGSPDADIKVRVRGGTSLTQSNEPLYIVDGFPVSSISDIAPSDIASMDVLKDAAATAIYGAQGANGVIIITTKDNDSGDDQMTFHVDYSGYVGWKRMAKKYDMMDNRDFVLMQYEQAYLSKGEKQLKSNFSQYFDNKVARDAQNKPTSDATLTPIGDLLDYWAEQPNFDWQRRTFGPTWGESMSDGEDFGYSRHNGFNSNHSVSISGGNKNATFTLSYNRIDDKAIMYGSDYARNNLSFKTKFKPVKNLTVGVTARYSNTEVLGSGANTNEDAGSTSESRVRNAVAYTPLELIAKDDVNTLDDFDAFGSLYDPITTIDHNYRQKFDNKWNLQGYASYKFLKKFTAKTELGYEGRYRDQNRLYGPTTYYSRDGDGKNRIDAAGYNHVQVTDQRNTRLRNTNTVEYKTKFGSDHNFDALVGEEQTWNKGEEQVFYGFGYDRNFTGEDIFYHLNEAIQKDFKNTVGSTDNMLSFFARANYNFRGRYYLTATLRADASTRFAKGNQWGIFPSVAAAWRVSDEEWMGSASEWLSNLKLRLSYGTAGNNNVETGYLFFNYLPSTDSYMSGFGTGTFFADGGSDKIAANNKLKWETTYTRDLGIDYGFFNERLSGAIDLYWNTTEDLIIKYQTSVGGYSNQYRNIGSTENKGIEFSVRGVILDHRASDLSYGLTADANIAFNWNKIKSLGGLTEYKVSSSCFSGYYETADQEYLIEVGQAMGRIYGFKTDGWFTANDFAQYDQLNDLWLDANGNQVNTIIGAARPGMAKLVNEKGELATSLDDRTVIGNALPLFTGGVNLSAFVGADKWGKVDFGANFTYSVGNDVLNMTGMDFSTVVEKTKLRNLTSAVGYGQRYSMFTNTGEYLPASAIPTEYESIPGTDIVIKSMVSGAEYAALANTLEEQNRGASAANPVQAKTALTDQYVEDASFLRLSTLTIGYTLPKLWLEKAHLSNARVYIQGSNLFCLTNYSGLDPEVDTRSKKNPLAMGVDFSAYPKSRGINIGMNLTF